MNRKVVQFGDKDRGEKQVSKVNMERLNYYITIQTSDNIDNNENVCKQLNGLYGLECEVDDDDNVKIILDEESGQDISICHDGIFINIKDKTILTDKIEIVPKLYNVLLNDNPDMEILSYEFEAKCFFALDGQEIINYFLENHDTSKSGLIIEYSGYNLFCKIENTPYIIEVGPDFSNTNRLFLKLVTRFMINKIDDFKDRVEQFLNVIDNSLGESLLEYIKGRGGQKE